LQGIENSGQAGGQENCRMSIVDLIQQLNLPLRTWMAQRIFSSVQPHISQGFVEKSLRSLPFRPWQSQDISRRLMGVFVLRLNCPYFK
jgi:hypothetical protein